jgi:hypothetical protein
MPDYRRSRVEGGSYCFTVTVDDRRSALLVAEIGALRGAVLAARARRYGVRHMARRGGYGFSQLAFYGVNL